MKKNRNDAIIWRNLLLQDCVLLKMLEVNKNMDKDPNIARLLRVNQTN